MCASPPAEEAVRVEPQPEMEPPALDLIDDIQGVHARLSTARMCHPTRCSTDAFLFPVDTAYTLSPTVLRAHRGTPIIVYDTDGTVRNEITTCETATHPPGRYTVDICSLGLKVYLIVQGELEIRPDEEQGYVIDCSSAETVQLGLRSLHTSPAATVTTTDQPRDIMRALSCLGSALKTTSCERSFPTLRGHPPLLERGERFHAPPDLERTDETASVRIEVPPTLESLYPIAPLAYYLNAVVQPGGSPRLVAGDTTYPLDQGDGVETGAAQLLKHVFTLDCITRTEGFYPFTLGERETLERRFAEAGRDEIDFAAIYEQSIAEQVQSYLSIPFEMVGDLVQRWPLTADVLPVPKYLPYLPFVVASLGTVRCLPTSCPRSTASVAPAVEDFCRHPSNSAEIGGLKHDGDAVSLSQFRSRSSENTADLPSNIYSAPTADSITQICLTDGYPVQGAKPTLSACKRRFDATPAGTSDVAVVSNDTAMQAESDVAELYERCDHIAFDVTMYEELSRDDLQDVLASEYDLVHYVGHVDTQGLQCADGWLDAHRLDTVGTRIFVLNGCRSYTQGMALVDAGAIGGLCTLTNVGNTPATHVGRMVARLLNTGFSLGGALDIISEDSLAGQQYMIVGDPSLAIVQNQEDTPTLVEITPAPDDDTFTVDIHGYPSSRTPIGMLYIPIIDDNETYYLNSGHLTSITVSRSALAEYLQHGRFPVRIDGSLTWNDAVSIDSIE